MHFYCLRNRESKFFFFFNDTATTEIYTLSLHDALPISSLSILPMSILRARREAIMSTRPVARFSFRSRAIETRPWTFSIGSALIARSPVTRAPVGAIFALMLRVTLGRHGLVHPRRQHFQVDQFVEFDRGVRHECSLPQGENKNQRVVEFGCAILANSFTCGAAARGVSVALQQFLWLRKRLRKRSRTSSSNSSG